MPDETWRTRLKIGAAKQQYIIQNTAMNAAPPASLANLRNLCLLRNFSYYKIPYIWGKNTKPFRSDFTTVFITGNFHHYLYINKKFLFDCLAIFLKNYFIQNDYVEVEVNLTFKT